MRSPVFRHAGSWRHAGTTRRSPQLPPRRWWQAIIAPQTICYIIYNQDNTHKTTAGAQPTTASWVAFSRGDLVRPACRHDLAWRNTGLRTATTACRGDGNARLRSSSPPRRRAGSAPNGKPRGGVPDCNDPALTQLCRGCGVPPTTACRRYAPVAQWSVKARLKSEEWRGLQILVARGM